MRLFFLLLAFLLALLSGYWFVAIMLVTWIAYWHPSYWIFIAVVLVDGYYGSFYGVPVLSLAVGHLCYLLRCLKYSY